MKYEIVLASKSARRYEILTNLGLKPEVIVSDADENIDSSLPPETYTEKLSILKASTVKDKVSKDKIIIASDTVVYANNEILGKPKDRNDARRMLKMLSGSTHKVVSGVAVIHKDKISYSSDSTEVTFRELSDSEIEAYLDTDEPYDKAGAYGIQDNASVFIRKINGDYFNVVGLPVYKLFELLKKEFNIDFFELKK